MTHTETHTLDLRNPSVSLDPAISGEYSFQLAAAKIAISQAVTQQRITGLEAREIAAAIRNCMDAGSVHSILSTRLPIEMVEAAKVEVALQAHYTDSTAFSIPDRFRFDRPEALSTGGGKVTGFDFSDVPDGIYWAETSVGGDI